MDGDGYKRLLSYVLCELTVPTKKHVYNFLADEQGSLNHHLLTAAISSVKNEQYKNFTSCKLLKKSRSNIYLSRRNTLAPPKTTADFVNNTVPVLENVETEMLTNVIEDDKLVNQSIIMPQTVGESSEEENTGFFDDKLVFRETIEEPHNTHPDEVVLSTSSQTFQYEEDCFDAEQEDQNDNKTSQKNTEYSVDDTDVNDDVESFDEISCFYSDPLLLCSEADFKIMFRMSRSSFQNLLVVLSKEEMEPIENVPLYKKALIVLWLMGNSGSYSDAAQVFSVSEEAAANSFFDVCATLYNRSEQFIKWPSVEERTQISSRIEEKYGFSGVVGILGCQYFSICIPKEPLARREHFNAKERIYSVAMQVVCDDNLGIRDIFPGLPGSVPEAQVLRDSPLCEQLTCKSQSDSLVEPHKHILARSEYPQLKSMLTPYMNATTLSADEVEFNKLHESVCQLVDQTFQMLQDRFMTLKLLDPEVATMVLVTASVLHNICIENQDRFEHSDNIE